VRRGRGRHWTETVGAWNVRRDRRERVLLRVGRGRRTRWGRVLAIACPWLAFSLSMGFIIGDLRTGASGGHALPGDGYRNHETHEIHEKLLMLRIFRQDYGIWGKC
jgi:hypothetical protein